MWIKNPAYGRQSISRPMRIVAPMPQKGGPRQNQQKKNFLLRGDIRPLPNKNVQMLDHFIPLQKKTFFARQFQTILKQKCSYLRPLLSITFPQGFRISKNIGHPTSESGGKKTVKRYLKSEQTHGQTDTRTDRRTFRLIESIGPEGRCFENYMQHVIICQNVNIPPNSDHENGSYLLKSPRFITLVVSTWIGAVKLALPCSYHQQPSSAILSSNQENVFREAQGNELLGPIQWII